jgi:hypothetical protein
MEELGHAVDDYILGRVDARDLPMIAAHALARCVDSPALRQLAGLARTEPRDAADLLDRAMTELGRPLRPPRTVLWDRARRAAAELVSGSVDAPTATGEIAALLFEADRFDARDSSADQAWRFELLSLGWDDHPDDRPAIVEQMRFAARDLLNR